MTTSAIEAVYVYDQNNEIVLEHIYLSRPPTARSCLSAYQAQPTPRSAVSYQSRLSPPSTLIVLQHNGLLFLVPSVGETDPLATMTFLGRFVDILEDFVGGPLTAAKIVSNYDVIAQILAETVDGGYVATTEPNALKETVTTQGWVDKLLGGVGLPPGISSSGSGSGSGGVAGLGAGGGRGGLGGLGGGGGSAGGFRPGLLTNPSAGPQVPWRRPNVRHTSNELYVDMVESLSVLLAPSGRPLSARVHGSILFTARISGVPDLLLNLKMPGGGKSQVGQVLEAPSFHPCVRLSRWRDNPGELSFVPPDGKFMLAGYEVNLLPAPTADNGGLAARSAKQLDLPVNVEVRKSLGDLGMEFEVRLSISGSIGAKGGSSSAAAQLRALSSPRGSGNGSGRSTPSLFGNRDSGTSNAPMLNDVVVEVPVPRSVRNVTDLRSSRGEASFDVRRHTVEWRISAKEAAGAGVATLRCTVTGQGNDVSDDDDGGIGAPQAAYSVPTGAGEYEYDEVADAYQGEDAKDQEAAKAGTSTTAAASGGKDTVEDREPKRVQSNKVYMPSCATVSFSVKGWLASGLKVDSLNIDTNRSRGLGDGIKPVKGAKYLTVSKKGIETRC